MFTRLLISSLLISALPLFATAQANGDPGENSEYEIDFMPLPNEFDKGINVDYIYGNVNWLQNYPYGGYTPGTTGMYSVSRCAALLSTGTSQSTNDFFKIHQAFQITCPIFLRSPLHVLPTTHNGRGIYVLDWRREAWAGRTTA